MLLDPPPVAIVAAVERIVRSRAADAGSASGATEKETPLTPKLKEFLKFIVDRYVMGITNGLSGDALAQTLSEETIAVDFFQKNAVDFQVKNLSNVTNIVTRLRQALIRYYEEHPEEQFVIQIPKAKRGQLVCYIPVISWQLPEPLRELFRQAFGVRERRTKTSFEYGIEALKTILKETNHAPTKAYLAELYTLRIMHGITPADAADGGLLEAQKLAEEALNESMYLWAGYIAKGAVHLCRHQWHEAAEAFEQARTLDEGRTLVQPWYFFFLVIDGRVRDAIHYLQEALIREDHAASTRRNLCLALILAGEYKWAQRELIALVQNERAHFLFHLLLGMAYCATEDYTRALEQVRLARSMPDSEFMSSGMLVLTLGKCGHTEEAEKELQELLNRKRKGDPHLSSWQLAIAYIGFENSEEDAIAWLESAADAHDPLVLLLRNWPMMRGLHAHPRFQALLARLQYPGTRTSA